MPEVTSIPSISALTRLVETERYPDHVIAALTLEPAGAGVRWTAVVSPTRLLLRDHLGDRPERRVEPMIHGGPEVGDLGHHAGEPAID